VKEEAVKSLTDLQEMNSNVRHGIISPDSAVTLATTLTSKLFTNKFTDDLLSKQIPAVSRTLLEVFLPFPDPLDFLVGVSDGDDSLLRQRLGVKESSLRPQHRESLP
jgi:hypothetical protein